MSSSLSLSQSRLLLATVCVIFGLGNVASSHNVSSSGCTDTDEAFHSGVNQRNLTGGRSYQISKPDKYSKTSPSPLIISFHGAGESTNTQLNSDQLTNSDINDEYIIIYPESIDGQWQVSPDSDTDDIGFVSDILDDVESAFCVDLSRIYATGKSQGGGMAGLLACDEEMSQKFAAFAPVSGAFYVKDENGCDPATVNLTCSPGRDNIPMLEFHGGDDDVAPYEGDDDRRDACLPDIPYWVQSWAKRNDLGTDNTSSEITSSATLYQFGDDSNLGLVSHVYDGSGIGHVWPRTKTFAEKIGGSSTASFNATTMILDFFGKYVLNSTKSDGTPTSTPSPSGGDGSDTGGTPNSTDDGSAASTAYPHGQTLWWLLGFYLARVLI